MNLLKINDYLTKGMIGVFASVFLFSLLTLLMPIIGYLVVVLLIILFLLAFICLITSTILFVIDVNEKIDNFFKYYKDEE
jgi:hypothetical protein